MSALAEFVNELVSWATDNIEVKQVSKGNHLLAAGEIEHNIYFIIDGAVRVTYLTELEEFTIRFGYKQSIITSIASFFSGFPSEYSIEALRKTSYYQIPKSQFIELVQQNQSNQLAYQAILEDLVLQQMEREIDLLTDSPSERLHRVLMRSPLLFQEIPLKYIASYLRMSPETLSRIRKS